MNTPTPSCPVCWVALPYRADNATWLTCESCGAVWNQSARRAQPTPPMDEAAEMAAYAKWRGVKEWIDATPWHAWMARAKGGRE